VKRSKPIGSGKEPIVTTPNVTQNTLSVTQHAQEAFVTAVNDLMSILNGVLDANGQLTSVAMVSQAGAKFGSAISQWLDDFWDLKGTLSWMAEQLATQLQQMAANEQNNTDLASGIGCTPLPGYGSFPPSLATPAHIFVAQTIPQIPATAAGRVMEREPMMLRTQAIPATGQAMQQAVPDPGQVTPAVPGIPPVAVTGQAMQQAGQVTPAVPGIPLTPAVPGIPPVAVTGQAMQAAVPAASQATPAVPGIPPVPTS
jgi:hypothetical protein